MLFILGLIRSLEQAFGLIFSKIEMGDLNAFEVNGIISI